MFSSAFFHSKGLISFSSYFSLSCWIDIDSHCVVRGFVPKTGV